MPDDLRSYKMSYSLKSVLKQVEAKVCEFWYVAISNHEVIRNIDKLNKLNTDLIAILFVKTHFIMTQCTCT